LHLSLSFYIENINLHVNRKKATTIEQPKQRNDEDKVPKTQPPVKEHSDKASGTTINTRTRTSRVESPPPSLRTLNPPTQGRRTRTTVNHPPETDLNPHENNRPKRTAPSSNGERRKREATTEATGKEQS
jgi:hypothetical protein